jgi:hypothetical protein
MRTHCPPSHDPTRVSAVRRRACGPPACRKRPMTLRKRARGDGRLFQPHYHDPKTKALKRSANWSFRHHVNGKTCQIATGATNYNAAARIARAHLTKHAGRQLAGNFERTTFADLAALLLQDYKINARKSLERVTGAVKHLTEAFDDKRLARDITAPAITAYVEARQAAGAGAANATINQELAALRRMFRLGERAGLVATRPFIGLLHLNNVRKGFCTRHRLAHQE